MRKLFVFVLLFVSAPLLAKGYTPTDEIALFLAAMEKTNAHNQTEMDDFYDVHVALEARIDFLEKRVGHQDSYILVNIGSQTLTIIDGGNAIHKQDVIVGRDSRPTPIFSDHIKYIVTNPYWNAPMSLARKDVLPKLRKNPSLIDSLGFEMLKQGTHEVVDFDLEADLRKFRIRQNPGPTNALGQIKFMFDPNPRRSIYMHDTPKKHLFEEDVRRFSSGCIRLSEPSIVQKYVMRGTKVPKSSRTDRWVKLPVPVVVHVVDWGVYLNEDGDIIMDDKTGRKMEFSLFDEAP